MNLATTKNLTILGILIILKALSVAGVAFTDGDPATVVDWASLAESIITGVGLILAKGAGTTGVQTIGGKPV